MFHATPIYLVDNYPAESGFIIEIGHFFVI